MPGASHVGVSQRIESETGRERLKKVVAEYCRRAGWIYHPYGGGRGVRRGSGVGRRLPQTRLDESHGA